MAKVTLICGTLCSGKTTLAKRICEETGAVRLSCDDLMLALFPDDALGAEYETYAARAKQYLLTRAEELCAAGVDVVLDWGFWTRAEREATSRRFAARKITVQWLRTNLNEDTWQQYIAARNLQVKSGLVKDYFVDDGLKSKALTHFETLTDDELKLYATFS